MSTVGRNIAIRRKGLRLSQKELAEKSKVNPSHLNRIEKGVSRAGPNALEAISKVLGCTPEDLVQRPIQDDFDVDKFNLLEPAAFSLAGAVLTKLADLSPSARNSVLAGIFADSPEILEELLGPTRNAK